MLKIVKESKLIYFSAYCLLVGCTGIYFGSKKSDETFYITPIKEISELRKISKNSKNFSFFSIFNLVGTTEKGLSTWEDNLKAN